MTPSLDRGRLTLAASALTRYPFLVWWYGDSIGLEGLLAAADVLERPEFEAWVHGIIKGWIPRAQPFKELDNTSPGHAIVQAFERVDDETLVDAATELATFLRSRRVVENAFVSFEQSPLHEPHGGATLETSEAELLESPGAGVFVDCLHFDPPFFAHLAQILDDTPLLDTAATQAAAYVKLLQGPDGFFSHFWLEKTGRAYGHGWGRGQGWALLGLGDVLERLPTDHRCYDELSDAYGRLCEALLATQRPDGGWPTVVSAPGSSIETSTGAFAAAGFAQGITLGLLDSSYSSSAVGAWANAASAVDSGGKLTGVSTAVWPCTHPSHYLNVPTGYLVPWGQGPLLLATKRLIDLKLIRDRR
jgi:unsaturated rhamnogalacturonyl hydrolase